MTIFENPIKKIGIDRCHNKTMIYIFIALSDGMLSKITMFCSHRSRF